MYNFRLFYLESSQETKLTPICASNDLLNQIINKNLIIKNLQKQNMEDLPKSKAKAMPYDQEVVNNMLECGGVNEFVNLLDTLY